MTQFNLHKSRIDTLVERWSTAFKNMGHIVDIYENPGPSDKAEMGKQIRFILDGKTKTVYAWNAHLAMHNEVWSFLRTDLNDSRTSVFDGTFLTGQQDRQYVDPSNLQHLTPNERQKIKSFDWSFGKKYFDIEDIIKMVNVSSYK